MDVIAHRLELLGEELVRAAVDPLAREEVVAGAEEGEHRARGGAHAAAEDERGLRALEEGEALLQELGGRVVPVARIAQTVGGADLLDEVDRLEERRDDRGVGVLGVARAVQGERGESGAAFGRGHVGSRLRGLAAFAAGGVRVHLYYSHDLGRRGAGDVAEDDTRRASPRRRC